MSRIIFPITQNLSFPIEPNPCPNQSRAQICYPADHSLNRFHVETNLKIEFLASKTHDLAHRHLLLPVERYHLSILDGDDFYQFHE